MVEPEPDAADPSVPTPYGHGDRLGSYAEVDGAKRAGALALLDLARPIRTFNLSDGIEPGYPGSAGRTYEQHLVVAGFDPGPGYLGECHTVEPVGSNRLSFCEERMTGSYNMSTKINGFAHAGVEGTFYDGTRGPEFAATSGLTDLDVLTWGPPLLTRGILLDVVAHRVATTGDVEETANGRVTLPGNAHVTIADLEACLESSGAGTIEPGDAVLLRTGWINLTRTDAARFLRESPGPWLSESRWLAAFRPALVGTDSFMWGTFDPTISGGQLGANHQLLFVEYGIRIGESVFCEELADAGVTTFVFCHAPLPARGAVSSNSPPIAIANVGDYGAM